jgi:hypothetical protein
VTDLAEVPCPRVGAGQLLIRTTRSTSGLTLCRRGLFDPKAVADLVADNRTGRVDAAYTILGLVCIEIWCRAYVN